jgi:hypothetical protein
MMTAIQVLRIVCDNPECVVYVDELTREDPVDFALVEHVRSLTLEVGWTRVGSNDFCPAHANAEQNPAD